MSEMIMGLEGAQSDDSRLAVTNALFRYSGVLDVDVSPDGAELRVRYDPSNILAWDLEEAIRGEGCSVKWVKHGSAG